MFNFIPFPNNPKNPANPVQSFYNNSPAKKRYATLKYIINPVTSTSVATKGADETAGSAPSRFNIIGSIEPLRVPHNTTPTNDTPTVIPIKNQCVP